MNNQCRTARLHLSDHLDGETMPFWRRLFMRLHLTICPPCRRVRRSLLATRDSLLALRDSDVDS